MSRVLGVLGGKDTPLETLWGWASSADLVVAADSGADACLSVGIRPLVIGDMDSFKGDRTGLELLEDPDQDTTDCDKLLAWVAAQGHRAVTMACVEGDRLDHVLATLASLARCPLDVSLVSRRAIGRIVRAGEGVAVEAAAGTRFSVLGVGPCVATIAGARWPVESADLTPPLPQSISNRVQDATHVSVESGRALLMVEAAREAWQFPWG
jgi:thiamine pyrophosphokinase